jgi:hypothetical protein
VGGGGLLEIGGVLFGKSDGGVQPIRLAGGWC